MKKVAVFGNAGGGKSKLSKQISARANLPLYVLDKIQYRHDGSNIPAQEFKNIHEQILVSEQWLVDGFGSLDTLWQRLDQADTLVYVDLPLLRHFWWVTKRFLTGLFVPPEGWPQGCPVFQSSMNSYRVLWLCHRRLTPKYRDYVAKSRNHKRVVHLQSVKDIQQFLQSIAP